MPVLQPQEGITQRGCGPVEERSGCSVMICCNGELLLKRMIRDYVYGYGHAGASGHEGETATWRRTFMHKSSHINMNNLLEAEFVDEIQH